MPLPLLASGHFFPKGVDQKELCPKCHCPFNQHPTYSLPIAYELLVETLKAVGLGKAFEPWGPRYVLDISMETPLRLFLRFEALPDPLTGEPRRFQYGAPIPRYIEQADQLVDFAKHLGECVMRELLQASFTVAGKHPFHPSPLVE